MNQRLILPPLIRRDPLLWDLPRIIFLPSTSIELSDWGGQNILFKSWVSFFHLPRRVTATFFFFFLTHRPSPPNFVFPLSWVTSREMYVAAFRKFEASRSFLSLSKPSRSSSVMEALANPLAGAGFFQTGHFDLSPPLPLGKTVRRFRLLFPLIYAKRV